MFGLLLLTAFLSLPAFAAVEPPADLLSWEKSCADKDGLACAKAAYHYKKTDPGLALKYYQKGCELKDESACFNMNSINPREIFYTKADGIMKFNSQNITNCYVPAGKTKYSAMQFKEVWHRAIFRIHIDQQGKADSVSVQTDLSKSFVDCAKKVIQNINFPKPQGFDPSYDYNLTLSSLE